MLVVLAIAAIAILACVVLVSLGRGGELTDFPPDVPPLELPEPAQLTAVDFMALQLPVNLVGYHTQSVDETLRRAASAISARDTRIAVLEQRVSELLSSRLYARQESHAAPGAGPRTDHAPQAPATYRELPESGDPVPGGGPWDDDAEGQYAQWRVPPRDAAVEQASNGASQAGAESREGDDGTGAGPSSGDGPADGGEAADQPEGVPPDGEGPQDVTRDGERGEPPADPIEADTAGTDTAGTETAGTDTIGTEMGSEPVAGEARGEAETPARSTPGDDRS
ncbi:hypothetical protein [Nonomuraea sp. B1E8]|uniref:hypothetical protein n=1 Tax=unclassified Nonomuraea TaxID=2593643 RepID=UPI00325E180F